MSKANIPGILALLREQKQELSDHMDDQVTLDLSLLAKFQRYEAAIELLEEIMDE